MTTEMSEEEGDSLIESQQKFDDRYEELLCQRKLEKTRSYSQRQANVQRGLMDEDFKQSQGDSRKQSELEQEEPEEEKEEIKEELPKPKKNRFSELKKLNRNLKRKARRDQVKDGDSDVTDIEDRILCSQIRKKS